MSRTIYVAWFALTACAQTFSVTRTYQYSQPLPTVYPNRHNWYNKGFAINPINKNESPSGAPGACAGMIAGMPLAFLRNIPGTTASLNGFRPFPASSWYDDVSLAPADTRSPVWTSGAFGSGNQTLRLASSPDRYEPVASGTGAWLHIVGKDQPKVEIRYDSSYPDQVDPGPLRVPLWPAVQNSNGSSGFYNVPGYDRHLSVIDRDNCVAIDLYGVNYYEGKIRAYAGAVFDLLAGDHQRPYFATSANVAGTQLGAFLLNWDEIDAQVAGQAGGRALPWAMWGGYGLTGATGSASHHQYTSGCGTGADPANKPPFGARMRLKASYDVEAFLANARSAATNPISAAASDRLRVLLNNLKKYGFVYTDGSNTPDFWLLGDSRVEYGMTYQLMNNGPRIADDFEFAQVTTSIYADCYGKPHPGTTYAPIPAIGSFGLATSAGSSADPVAAGSPVALVWSVANVSNRLRWVVDGAGGGPGLVDMKPDMSAPDSVVVRPLRTTTYWLMVQSGAESGRKVSSPVTVYVR